MKELEDQIQAGINENDDLKRKIQVLSDFLSSKENKSPF
jgi:hypothetical protein